LFRERVFQLRKIPVHAELAAVLGHDAEVHVQVWRRRIRRNASIGTSKLKCART